MSFLKWRKTSQDHFDGDHCDNEDENIVIGLILFYQFFAFNVFGKETPVKSRAVPSEKSSKLYKATPKEAIRWLKKLLTSSGDMSWYNYC